ncbi:MAG: nucleotidyltransferase family protein, partial [Pseudomonadota bacterium]
MTAPGWRALVLAGERPEGDPLAAAEGAPCKAFIPIAGRPMIAHVLGTLAEVAEIGEVAVTIAPDAPAIPPGPWQRRAAAAGPSASVAEGFAALGAPLLVVTADHPMLTAATVRAFLRAAEAHGATAIAGVATADVVARAEDAPRRTMMRFRGGAVTGCNLFALLRPDAGT